MATTRRSRLGLTLVELLVVIAIIGLLAGLLLPAVLQSRATARKSQCGHHLAQLAKGVQQFHERQGTLPAYWGTMKASGGEKFGGWLMHMLPDIDQQGFYDTLPVSNSSTRYKWTITGTNPGDPGELPYNPGTWVTSTIGTVTLPGPMIVPITKTELVGATGRAPIDPQPIWGWADDPSGSVSLGMPPTFAPAQASWRLPIVKCSDDPSPVGPVLISNVPWELTNYLANAHVFTQFSSPRISSTTSMAAAGMFDSPRSQRPDVNWGVYHHLLSGTVGTLARQLGHVTDGLSNTILFGEGMRQCNGGGSYRFALLPAGYLTHEHSFGIETALWDDTAKVFYAGTGFSPPRTYGNTLMFQSQPEVKDCNSFRIQSLHGPFLNVAMCDGSVRAISSYVSRREVIDPEACGRRNFSKTNQYYGAESRGALAGANDYSPLGDQVWDMLMVPADPPVNVLPNTGEIGKEK